MISPWARLLSHIGTAPNVGQDRPARPSSWHTGLKPGRETQNLHTDLLHTAALQAKTGSRPHLLTPLEKQGTEGKGYHQGQSHLVPLNPSLPLNSEISAHMSTYCEAKHRQTVPPEIQNGKTGRVKGQFPAQVPPQVTEQVAGTC